MSSPATGHPNDHKPPDTASRHVATAEPSSRNSHLQPILASRL